MKCVVLHFNLIFYRNNFHRLNTKQRDIAKETRNESDGNQKEKQTYLMSKKQRRKFV